MKRSKRSEEEEEESKKGLSEMNKTVGSPRSTHDDQKNRNKKSYSFNQFQSIAMLTDDEVKREKRNQ